MWICKLRCICCDFFFSWYFFQSYQCHDLWFCECTVREGRSTKIQATFTSEDALQSLRLLGFNATLERPACAGLPVSSSAYIILHASLPLQKPCANKQLSNAAFLKARRGNMKTNVHTKHRNSVTEFAPFLLGNDSTDFASKTCTSLHAHINTHSRTLFIKPQMDHIWIREL